MIFIVGGGLGLCALLVAAAWMGALSRREPDRRYRVGGYRGMRAADVTFGVWIRRYFPRSMALCLVLIGLGVVLLER